MNYNEILDRISCEYNRILSDNLVGIYVHGSIAFGCFNWDKSDIDFLVVTKEIPSLEEKKELIKALMELDKVCPPKGLEMSLVLEKVCSKFVYPTPFELHFSNAHKEKCKSNIEEYVKAMNGVDKDLAAHFTVIRSVGIVLCGKDIATLFGEIPKANYIDSIKCDVECAEDEIVENPIYIVLNLCRVLAYMRENLIISKEQGGLWGIKKLPSVYVPVIKEAVKCYQSNECFSMDFKLAKEFSQYMVKQIFVDN